MSKEKSVIRRAIISVTNKSRIEELACVLSANEVEIISSGGTKKYLEEKGYKVTDIEAVTGNPEAFAGRMKTLSFQVSSGILYRRGNANDEKQLGDLNILGIDLVVVNLYEFEKTKSESNNEDDWIEAIDIGGPTMLRAAAKNYHAVTVLPDEKYYDEFIKEYSESLSTSVKFRKTTAIATFNMMARYDLAIARAFSEQLNDCEYEDQHFDVTDRDVLRYGENPHQRGYLIKSRKGLAAAKSLQGKKLSYNNYLDADAALRSCHELLRVTSDRQFCASVVKHGNACGQAIAGDLLTALKLAWSGDPVSAFGGIICLGSECNLQTAQFLQSNFVEIIMAPSFSVEALEIFSAKKNLRLIVVNPSKLQEKFMLKSIDGGMLVQEIDNQFEKAGTNPTKNEFPAELMGLVEFGVLSCKGLKSNAIALVSNDPNGDRLLVGAGMGNPNRIISIEQAVQKAKANGVSDFSKVVLVSDAFFPFDDGIKMASKYGIKYIVQPGGSIKDELVVETANELGVAMILTGVRHFNH